MIIQPSLEGVFHMEMEKNVYQAWLYSLVWRASSTWKWKKNIYQAWLYSLVLMASSTWKWKKDVYQAWLYSLVLRVCQRKQKYFSCFF